MNETAGNLEHDQEVDLLVLLSRVLSKPLYLILSILLFTSASGLAAFLITPIYSVSVLLAPASPERSNMNSSLSSALGQLGGLAAIAGVNVGGTDVATQEAIAVLKSREFTERFISDLNLMPKLFPHKWDENNQKWKGGVENWPTPAKAYRLFDQSIRSVVEDKKTGLVRLQIDWRDREEAATWANILITRLNSEMRQRAIDHADASVGYLDKELATTSAVDTRSAINRLMETQIDQRMLANVTQEYAFRIVDKATAPDKSDVAWPNRLIFMVGGFLLGAFAGVLLALKRTRSSPPGVLRSGS
jgi:uncharacterized protein involved in exopolysaccharide biosynthesis